MLGKMLSPGGKLATGIKVFGRVGSTLFILSGLTAGSPVGGVNSGGLPKESPRETDAINSVGTGGGEIGGNEMDGVEIGGEVNDILN